MTLWSWWLSFATQVYKGMNRLSQVKTCWSTTSLAREYSRPYLTPSLGRCAERVERWKTAVFAAYIIVKDSELFPRDVCFSWVHCSRKLAIRTTFRTHRNSRHYKPGLAYPPIFHQWMYISKVESIGSCWFQCYLCILACEMGSEFTREVGVSFLPAQFSWIWCILSVFKAILSIQTLSSHNWNKSQLITHAGMQIRIWYWLRQGLTDSLFQIIDSLNTI